MRGASLEGYIESASALFDVAHPERSALWSARLSPHVADLAAVARAQLAHEVEPLGLPPAATGMMPAPTSCAAEACGLSQLAQDVVSGAVDPVARTEKFLQVIAAREELNAFMYVHAEGALRRAADLRDRRAAGAALGPLAGTVVAVKDCFAVRGMPLSIGTRAIPTRVPDHTARVVQRLQDADAIIIGTTTMHELAYGATSDNAHFGRVGHPQDPARVAGGSSGGSAVAVAAGMADVALGSDAAGSVRMPAALCGLVGFKPSYEVLSRDGVAPLSWTLDHVGLFASSVGDTALLVELMANLPAGSLLGGTAALAPNEIRLFRPRNYFCDVIDPGVLAAFECALEKLRSAGFGMIAGAIEGLELAPAIQFATLCSEAAEVQLDRALTDPDNLGHEVRVRLEAGQFVRAVDYIKAQRLRRSMRAALSAPLESLAEVLVTPTVITGACKPAATLAFGTAQLPIHPALTRCTLPFNLTGMPAITIPCGFDAQGFPVGLQIVGRFGQDAATLRVAKALESALQG
jgi:aspartyl-tRNA(Asn)/glutamyl-tRNA(Gln) amidotransferase subunit A